MRHVPSLHLNFLSDYLLDIEGYHNIIGDRKWKLMKGFIMVAKGKTRLYKTQLKLLNNDLTNELNAVEDNVSLEMRNKRLVYISEKGLQVLANKSLIPFAKCMN